MDKVDAVVVGAGVVGLAVARGLAMRGLETIWTVTGDPQPGEGALLRRVVEVVGVLVLVRSDDGDGAGGRVRVERRTRKMPAITSSVPW